MKAVIEKSNVKEVIELNTIQKGMLFHYLKAPENGLYNVQLSFNIEGNLDVSLLKEAFGVVQAGNDVLRSVFRWKEVRTPVQIILKEYPLDFIYLDLTGMDKADLPDYIEKYLENDRSKRFDLTQLPFRISVIETLNSSFVLTISHHHILYDGWSTGILLKELFHAYGRLKSGQEPDPYTKPEYKEVWRTINSNIGSVEGADYWKSYLSGYDVKLLFPELPAGSRAAEDIRKLYFATPNDRIESFAATYKVTKAAIVYAAYGLLLQKYLNVPDVVFGATVSNRDIAVKGLEGLMGNFINTVPVRVPDFQAASLLTVVSLVNESLINGAQFRGVPYAEIKQAFGQNAGESLFDSIIVIENYPLDKRVLDNSDLNLKLRAVYENTDVPLLITVFFTEELQVEFACKAGALGDLSLDKFFGHFITCLNKLLDEPGSSVRSLCLLSEEEQQQLLYNFNNTRSEYPRQETIMSLFEKQVALSPENIAIRYTEHNISYKELNLQSDRIAYYLEKELGIVPGSLVGIMLERDEYLVPSIFGVLKAGCAYVPIDPRFPAERINTILEDGRIAVLLTSSKYRYSSVAMAGIAVDLDKIWDALQAGPADSPATAANSESLAYVIYTSGSTGKPKGVMISHYSVVNGLLWMQEQYPLQASDVLMQKTPVVFDVSVWELFWWFISGASVCLLKPGGERDPAEITRVIERHQVSAINFVPSMLKLFLPVVSDKKAYGSLKSLRYVFASGEALSADLVMEFGNTLHKECGTRLINLYGPTEATVDTSYYECDFKERNTTIPIGRPIANHRLYVLDQHAHLQPVGVAGELYIAGLGLAQGYLNNPLLTSERFVSDPYAAGEWMYRTGDLARWRSDGNIEYLGRLDDQVKIRGFRIESGEIVSQLLTHGLVKTAVVLTRETGNDKYLVAYYVAEREIEASVLRDFLSAKLPEYMVPAYFVHLDTLPLNVNGKLDKKALPEYTISTAKDYVAPVGDTEQQLTEIWSEVLKLDKDAIGVTSSFFELGGHSLKAMLLANRIAREFSVEISLDDVFTYQDIRSFSKFIGKTQKTVYQAIRKAETKAYYNLSSSQKRLYFLYELDRSSIAYNTPFVVTLEGNLGKDRLRNVFAALVKRHESLRTSFQLEDGEPVQRIAPSIEFDLEYISNLGNGLDDIVKSFTRPFDVGKAPLLRVGLMQSAPQLSTLVVDMHHIITDGVSMEILMREFKALLNDEVLPPVDLQYKDYAEWLREGAQKTNIAEQKLFWRGEFSGESTSIDLPLDFSRTLTRSYEGGMLTFEVDADKTGKIKAIAEEQGATLFMALLSVYNILLAKLCNQEEIVVGTPVAGRAHVDVENIVGLFVNTLALKNYPTGSLRYTDFLADVRSRSLRCFANDSYPYEELIDELDITRDMGRNPLFDTVFVLQRFESQELETPAYNIRIQEAKRATAKFDLTLTATERNGGLFFNIEYAAELFRQETIEKFAGYFKNILSAIIDDVNIRIADIGILSEQERLKLLNSLDNTSFDYPHDKTIIDLFRDQALRTPDNIAVKFGDVFLSYRELDLRTDKLAVLLKNNGVKRGDIVGILLDRSIEVVMGMLAVLKAGGAYLPIDIEYPQERRDFIVKDSGTNLLLVSGCAEENTIHGVPTLAVEDWEILPDIITPLGENSQSDLCYVIYTSGTTGQPKGVMVEHGNLVRLFFNSGFQFNFDETDVWTMFHSPCFDFSVWEMYGALLFGGKLVIIPKMAARDTAAYLDILKRERVTVLNQTPSAFYNLIREELLCAQKELELRYVIFGGEALSPIKLKAWRERYPDVGLINMFGITETTVHVTYKEIGDNEIANNISNIGKPIPTLSVYVLDKYGKLVPQGTIGELYVGGAGVTRGYLGREQLTAQRFIPDPYHGGERLYRSGDLARVLASGDIEYLGRMDHQVQLRGFRIELGEIEAQLTVHTRIKEAVVLAGGEEDKYLIAYYVSDAAIDVNELRAHLSGRLPDYMVPAYYVRLNSLPLTINGKLDRKALPAPVVTLGSNYVAPVTTEEKLLAEIWSQVLGVNSIGITDNFFSAGGDSIKSLQIKARARTAGYELSVKDIFISQTIKELSIKMTRATRVSGQAPVTGKSPIAPVQRWFFDNHKTDPHHFNQSVMLHFADGISKETVQRIFGKLQRHHDALRMVFHRSAEEVIQENRGDELPLSIECCELGGSTELATATLLSVCNELQAGIDLENGQLMKLGLFHMHDGSRLLIVVHHLVIDAVSWRILFEDIETLYRQIKEEQALELPLKTDSFLLWSSRLLEHARKNFQVYDSYWKPVLERTANAIMRDYPDGSNSVMDSRTERFRLSTTDTSRLLKEVHIPLATRMNDILLSALLLGVKQHYGYDSLWVDVEGHGRMDIQPATDISRTLGWFTSIYPVLLESTDSSLPGMIRSVKEHLRMIPEEGAGYLLWKYQDEDNKQRKVGHVSQVCFNYLGQFDADLKNNSYQIAQEPRGNEISLKMNRLYDWEITAYVVSEQLELNLKYSRKQYKKESINAFINTFKESLQQIIDDCCSYERVLLSPSDLTYKALTFPELDKLQHKYALENIYPLSPMQEGMLFHSLLNEDASHYFEQMTCTVKGQLDMPALEKTMNDLMSRYDILRTVFLHEGYRAPIQVVLKERRIDFTYQDIREEYVNGPKGIAIGFYQQQDRNRKFNLDTDTLMRLSVLQVADDEFRFIWSHHHILMDGWCMGIIMRDFSSIYESNKRRLPSTLAPANPYSHFINWLQRRDKSESAAYWKKYLEAYRHIVNLPQKELLLQQIPYARASHQVVLDSETTAMLRKVSRTHGVTVNTILQAAWGILLAKYNNVRDVVFGAVVSGRPAEIDGIGSMIGLFINTIPVRVRYDVEGTVGGLLKDMQNTALTSEQYHYHPLSEIQALSDIGAALIDHILVFENYPVTEEIEKIGLDRITNPGEYQITDVQVFEQTNYDLSIIISPSEEIQVKYEYNANRYGEETIVRAAGHFIHILEQILAAGETPLVAVELLRPEERRQLIYEFNDTKVDYPKNQTIVSLFEEKAKTVPGSMAVKYGDSILTYEELKIKSDKIALYLGEVTGIVTGDLVGVLLERDDYFIAVVLGVLKAGAVYVPVDPAQPGKRIEAIIRDAGLKVLISSRPDSDSLADAAPVVIRPDRLKDLANAYPINQILPDVKENDLAYVIYTSGSTGTPKGVMVTHHALLNTLRCMQERYPIGEGDRYLLKTTCSFDVSLTEIFGWIPGGGAVSVLSPGAEANPGAIMELIKNEQVTHVNFVPSMFAAFISELERTHTESTGRLKYIFLAGEALPVEQVMRFRSLRLIPELINIYGPTEATIYSCDYPVKQFSEGATIPIGRPLSNVCTYILGIDGDVQPIGVAGELYIGGASLASGYWHNESLTAEKFTGDPYVEAGRIYKTGDIARYLPDGNIEFLGRADNQLKIRGVRIEPGEIESQLQTHEEIEKVVVTGWERNGSKYLVAYYVAQKKLDPAEIRHYLEDRLPGYMVPAYYVQLNTLPLTAAGKVDRQCLPIPEISNSNNGHRAASGPLEEKLIGIWATILGIDSDLIGMDSSFFELGGHSITAIYLMNAIHTNYTVDITLREIFNSATIEKMAKLIKGRGIENNLSIPQTAQREYYPVSSAQKRLFYGQTLDKDGTGYNISSVYEIREGADVGKIRRALQLLLDRHPGLRTSFRLLGDEVVQQVFPHVDLDLSMIDGTRYTTVQAAMEAFVRPFELSAAPLMRCGLMEHHVVNLLFIDIHHIVCDGVSLNILMNDFVDLYRGIELIQVDTSYVDYAVWQNNPDNLKEWQRTFWLEKLAAPLPVLDLPVSLLRPQFRTYPAGVNVLEVGAEQYLRIKKLSSAAGASDFMVLLSACYILLSKVSGNTDLIVGTDVMGRTQRCLKNIVGTFVNWLPLRLQIDPQSTYLDLLQQVKSCVLDAFDHQDFPYDEMISSLNEKNELNGNLFEVHFSFANYLADTNRFAKLKIAPYKVNLKRTTQLPFKMEVMEKDGQFDILFIYAEELFDNGIIELFVRYYHNILTAVLDNKYVKIDHVEMDRQLNYTLQD